MKDYIKDYRKKKADARRKARARVAMLKVQIAKLKSQLVVAEVKKKRYGFVDALAMAALAHRIAEKRAEIARAEASDELRESGFGESEAVQRAAADTVVQKKKNDDTWLRRVDAKRAQYQRAFAAQRLGRPAEHERGWTPPLTAGCDKILGWKGRTALHGPLAHERWLAGLQATRRRPATSAAHGRPFATGAPASSTLLFGASPPRCLSPPRRTALVRTLERKITALRDESDDIWEVWSPTLRRRKERCDRAAAELGLDLEFQQTGRSASPTHGSSQHLIWPDSPTMRCDSPPKIIGKRSKHGH